MNRERARELLPIIEAFANGEEIHKKAAPSHCWEPVEDVTGLGEYRIAPKPREFWVWWDDHTLKCRIVIPNESPYRDAIKVREVL